MARKRALTVAAICLPALVAMAGGFSQSANAALIAYYPLNGTTNNLVDPTNNGVVHGTTQYTSDQNGNANGAFAFDGATYISASASSFPTTDRTVFLWFNAETVATKPVFLGYGGGACGTSFFVGLNAGGGGDYYVTSHCGVNDLLYSYPSDPSGNWHSFAVTTDASGTNLYVDGSLVESNANFISNTAVAGTDLAIGVDVSPGGIAPYTDGNVGYFVGALDGVRIYDTALSAAEIAALSVRNPVPEPAPLPVFMVGLFAAGAAGHARRDQRRRHLR